MIEEKQEQNEEGNFYEDEADYYYNSALKISTKTDPGATRAKRIPLSKLKLEDEASLPEKPKELVVEPNEKHYDKMLSEVDAQIEHHKKSITALKEKIKAEKFGNNPEMTKLTQEKDQYKKEREPILAEILDLEKQVEGPRNKIKDYKNEKEHLQKEIEFYKVESLDAEIKSIQHKLGFASLSVGEEKKLIDRKMRIESQRIKVARYSEIVKVMKEIHSSNDQIFAKLKVLNESKVRLNEKIKVLSAKLKGMIDNKTLNAPVIKTLELQIENIRGEIDKCYEKKREINNEYDDKYYKFKEQQKLLKYIKDAEEKIAYLKKREEKDKKRREREEKENAANQITSTPAVAEVQEDPNAYEIATCEWLISYFKNLVGITDTVTQATEPNKTNSKKDDPKDALIPIKKNQDEFLIGISDNKKQDKKKKKDKVSKREQELQNSGLISLDISLIRKIHDLKLSPPVRKSDVNAFIDTLQKSLGNYKSNAQNNTTHVSNTIQASQENVTHTQVHQEQPQVNTTYTQVHQEQPEVTTTHSEVNLEQPEVTTTHTQVHQEQPEVITNHTEIHQEQHDVTISHSQVHHEEPEQECKEVNQTHHEESKVEEDPLPPSENNGPSDTTAAEQPNKSKIKLKSKVTMHQVEGDETHEIQP